MTEVKVETSTSVVLSDEKFTYDIFGNRIGVSLNGTQQLYTVYDGSTPYMDFNGSGTLTERYLSNPKDLNYFYGQVSAGGTTQWFLTDNLDSIRQVVSTSGSGLDTITYDPYGVLLNQTNSTNAPRFLFTGESYDTNSGTYLDGWREDNPVDGRWDTPDPLGLGADLNLYRYVENDPTNAIDPKGLSAIRVDGGNLTTSTTRATTVLGNQTNLQSLSIMFSSPSNIVNDSVQVTQQFQMEVFANYQRTDRDGPEPSFSSLLVAGRQFFANEIGHAPPHLFSSPYWPDVTGDNFIQLTGFTTDSLAYNPEANTVTLTDNPNDSGPVYVMFRTFALEDFGNGFTRAVYSYGYNNLTEVDHFNTVVDLSGNPVQSLQWSSVAENVIVPDIRDYVSGLLGVTSNPNPYYREWSNGKDAMITQGPDW